MHTNWISQENFVWLISTIILLAPPALYIIIRNTIKLHRQGVVKDLSAVFNLPGHEYTIQDDELIPSFEFVKYKYFLGRKTKEGTRAQEDFAWWAWATGLVALGILIASIAYFMSRYGASSARFLLSDSNCGLFIEQRRVEILSQVAFIPCEAARDSNLYIWINTLFAAAAGSYVYMMRNFFRAVNNFDFGPASYISAAKDFIVSLAAVSILYFCSKNVFSFFSADVDTQKISSLGLIPLAFVFGMLPGSAIKFLIDRSKLAHFKKQNPDIYKKISVTPVDIVDGIDSEIRDRLADHHINSTQNLATANPLMLFVETPYGVYQIMDWVAQAQLCCAVGPDKLVQFWDLGIRTLFDLERAALNKTYRSREYLIAIGSILFSDHESKKAHRSITNEIMEKLVVSAIQVKLDDPHVHRLRQIYIKVGERLGDTNRRFCDDYRFEDNSAADGYFRWLKRWIK